MEPIRFGLEPGFQSTAAVRRWLVEALSDAGLGSIAADAQLALAELVNNALVYAPVSPVEVDLRIHGDQLEVGVSDAAAERPRVVLPRPRASSVGGRGLMILDALADAWGVDDGDPGKRVWFRLRARTVAAG